MIRAHGLTGPRVTPEEAEAAVIERTYTVLPSGRVLQCEATLYNGFTVVGKSAVVFKENFRQEIGEKVAKDRAQDAVYEHLGFDLANRTWKKKQGIVEFMWEEVNPFAVTCLEGGPQHAFLLASNGENIQYMHVYQFLDILDECNKKGTAFPFTHYVLKDAIPRPEVE